MTRPSETTVRREDSEVQSALNYLLGIIVAFVALWLFGPLGFPMGWELLTGLVSGGIIGPVVRCWWRNRRIG